MLARALDIPVAFSGSAGCRYCWFHALLIGSHQCARQWDDALRKVYISVCSGNSSRHTSLHNTRSTFVYFSRRPFFDPLFVS